MEARGGSFWLWLDVVPYATVESRAVGPRRRLLEHATLQWCLKLVHDRPRDRWLNMVWPLRSVARGRRCRTTSG